LGAVAADPELSVVIPAYNEESRLPATLERVQAFLAADTRPYELVLVDDGSRDGTLRVMQQAAAERAEVHVVVLDGGRRRGEHRVVGPLL
jgi:undecaprenyl-phosphate 4-deoxy-4-formamido-L-arabinose transferase